MIIDSDGEQQAAKPAEPYMDNPIFEDEVEEYDASRPYDPFIQDLDLPLGAEVLHLSFPQLPSEPHHPTLESLPKLLSTNMIIATACSDSNLRILAIPIMPPSPESVARPELRTRCTVPRAGRGPFGEQMVVISSVAGHQSIPKGISITVTSQMLRSIEDVDMANAERDSPQTKPRSSSRSRSLSRSRPVDRDHSWELLVASHSDDLSGLLFISKVPFRSDTLGSGGGLQEQNIPWRMQTLTSPATSIAFNPSLFPAPRHSQLVVADSRGAVRVFDCKPQSDSDQGSWLFSLYPGFQSSVNSIARRKQVLDVQWVLGGKAIVVLLSDGEWGAWDVEKAGQKAGPKANGDTKSTPSGGASMAFTISGWVGGTPVSKSLIKSSKSRLENVSRLAPMTPGTRKVRQEALFSGSPATTNSQANRPIRGGLSVSVVDNLPNSKVDDESLLLWYGDSVTVIPSLFTHWQSKVKESGNLFGTGVRGQPKEYNNIHLGGEVRNGVSAFPKHRPNHGVKAETDTSSEMLITAEYRFIIVAPPKKPPGSVTDMSFQISSESVDQHLLAKGELNVDGMERILSGMSNGHGGDHRNGTNPKREVGFYPS